MVACPGPAAPSFAKVATPTSQSGLGSRQKKPGGEGHPKLCSARFAKKRMVPLREGQILKQLNPLFSFAFLSPGADLYQHPQGKTILFPQQNRLCASGQGLITIHRVGSQ